MGRDSRCPRPTGDRAARDRVCVAIRTVPGSAAVVCSSTYWGPAGGGPCSAEHSPLLETQSHGTRAEGCRVCLRGHPLRWPVPAMPGAACGCGPPEPLPRTRGPSQAPWPLPTGWFREEKRSSAVSVVAVLSLSPLASGGEHLDWGSCTAGLFPGSGA